MVNCILYLWRNIIKLSPKQSMKLERKGERGANHSIFCVCHLKINLSSNTKLDSGESWMMRKYVGDYLEVEGGDWYKDKRESVKELVRFICCHHINADLFILFVFSWHSIQANEDKSEKIPKKVIFTTHKTNLTRRRWKGGMMVNLLCHQAIGANAGLAPPTPPSKFGQIWCWSAKIQ